MDKGAEDSSTRLPRAVWRSWFIKQRDSFCMLGRGSACTERQHSEQGRAVLAAAL